MNKRGKQRKKGRIDTRGNLIFRPGFEYTLQTPEGEKRIVAGWIHYYSKADARAALEDER